MATKTIKTRIINKHATESDWAKAVNFIPKQGEIIVYDIDENYDYERFKIGDGTTVVSDLPFVVEGINIENGEGLNSIQQPKDSESWSSINARMLTHLESVDYTTGDGATVQRDSSGNFLVGAYGKNSTMMNGKSQTVGGKTHAEGSKTLAFENNAHAEGNATYAGGKHSHAEGNETAATGIGSHAEGNTTLASGISAHAEGSVTVAGNKDAHVEGFNTFAFGEQSHAEGIRTFAGIKGFNILGYAGLNIFYIDSIDGLTIGDTVSIITDKTYYDIGTITDFNNTGFTLYNHNVVLTPAGGNNELPTNIIVDSSNKAIKDQFVNTLFVRNKPDLGTKMLGHYAHAEGHETSAIGHCSHAEGYSTLSVGERSHVEGDGTRANGTASHAEGSSTVAYGYASHAEGYNTYASIYSHAEGLGTKAEGENSHAEGNGVVASGNNSHGEGLGTKAEGEGSHSEGNNTKAKGKHSHTEGYFVEAYGNYSHAEGNSNGKSYSGEYNKDAIISSFINTPFTMAFGQGSHVEGQTNLTIGNGSHAEGLQNIAAGDGSHAEGRRTIASGVYQHVQGKYNVEDTTDTYAHIVGGGTSTDDRKNIHTIDWDGNAEFAGTVNAADLQINGVSISQISPEDTVGQKTENGGEIFNSYEENIASEEFSHAEGDHTVASGHASHAEGNETQATNDYAHAEGYQTKASGIRSHAEGSASEAQGDGSHSEGRKTKAIGKYAHSEGAFVEAYGQSSHAEGDSNNNSYSGTDYSSDALISAFNSKSFSMAVGQGSHVEGQTNLALGQGSHAEGAKNIAKGNFSHVEGLRNISSTEYQHVQGKYNVEDSTKAHIVGGGTSTDRKNIHTIDWDGNAEFAGTVNASDLLINGVSISQISPEDTVGQKTEAGGEIFNDYDTNIAMGIMSHAEGSQTTAGVKAFNILMSEYGSDVYRLDDITGIQIGDTYSIRISTEEYYNHGTVLEIDPQNNRIKVDKFVNGSLVKDENGNVEQGTINNSFRIANKPTLGTKVIGNRSHAEGEGTIATCDNAHAEGRYTQALGKNSHAEGFQTIASNSQAHAEGSQTIASGIYSHAEGIGTKAYGYGSHAEGQDSQATGMCSHAEGINTIAASRQSHAEGRYTISSGACSHAEGENTIANGNCSHSEGYYTQATGEYQHVQGKYNIEDTENKYAHIIGNGTSNIDRKNIHTVDWEGDAWFAGDVYVGPNNYKLISENDLSSLISRIETLEAALANIQNAEEVSF